MGEGTQAKVRSKCSDKVPEELVCLLCKEMMQDAVLTPCCANAYCDECKFIFDNTSFIHPFFKIKINCLKKCCSFYRYSEPSFGF